MEEIKIIYTKQVAMHALRGKLGSMTDCKERVTRRNNLVNNVPHEDHAQTNRSNADAKFTLSNDVCSH